MTRGFTLTTKDERLSKTEMTHDGLMLLKEQASFNVAVVSIAGKLMRSHLEPVEESCVATKSTQTSAIVIPTT
jgi:hypothetical protein